MVVIGLNGSKMTAYLRSICEPYLHLALYLATADPQYRAAAKQYVRDHNPKSDDLRRLLSLSCRREASKILKS